MTVYMYILAGLFMPLFPLSMLYNILYSRIRNPVIRAVLLFVWPQIGLAIVGSSGQVVPHWIVVWAVSTALLYALRALTLREVGLWTSFVGTSAWALLWILLENATSVHMLQFYALGTSIPLVMMAMLGAGLERRFGAAYLGLYGGLAETIPRFSGVLVFVVLAIIATPLFPTFFAMLSMIIKTVPGAPLIATGVVIVWMLWSWAGAKLIQGLLAGTQKSVISDLNPAMSWLYSAVLIGLVIAGLYGSGVFV